MKDPWLQSHIQYSYVLNYVHLSKEVWKLNFRQDGQMEKHSQEEAPTGRKSEVRRSEVEKTRKGESQNLEERRCRGAKR